jgi:hypothetical protein
MAKDVSQIPWLLDAEGQSASRDATATVGNANTLSTRQRLFVQQMKISTGVGGTIEILTEAGGRRLFKAIGLPGSDQIWSPIGETWSGFYVNTLPSSAVIELYVGRT